MKKLGKKIVHTEKKNTSDPSEITLQFERVLRDVWGKNKKKSIEKPDDLDKRIFEVIAKGSVSIAFEAFLFRQKKEKIEIFLTLREKGESYEGQWHVPGSIFRPGEYPPDVLYRLSKQEFKSKMTLASECVYERFFNEERGWFMSRVYLVKAVGIPTKKGKWFEISRLPENLVEHQRTHLLPKAIEAFKKLRK